MKNLKQENINFREYKRSDEMTCASLLQNCYRDNGPRKSLDELQICVAFAGSTLIGFAGLERSKLHDTIVSLYLCVDENYRRNGFATKLHNELLKNYPLGENEVLDISSYADQTVERSFLESLGYSKYLQCFLNLYTPADLTEIHSSYKISSIDEFYKNSKLKHLVREFYVERYRQEHEGNMPVTLDECVWEDYFDDGDPLLGVVLHDDKKIYGISFAYIDFGQVINEPDKEVICINGYAIGETEIEEANNMMALYSYQCQLMQNREVFIYTEVDSTERVSSYIQKWLPKCDNSKIYERYQLKIKN